MKISEHSMRELLSDGIVSTRDRINTLQVQIASGKLYRNKSEAPAEAADVDALERVKRLNNLWQENISHAKTWAGVTEGQLTEATDIIQRVNELAVMSRDATSNTDAQLSNIAGELDGLLEQLVFIARELIRAVRSWVRCASPTSSAR